MGCGTSGPIAGTPNGLANVGRRPSKTVKDSVAGNRNGKTPAGMTPVDRPTGKPGDAHRNSTTGNRSKGGLKDDAQLAAEGAQGILDSRLPLSRREIFLLSKSWKTIARNMDITGVKVFTKIFLTNPELLPLFKNIRVDKTQINNPMAYENSMELETHSEIVMNTLDEAISSMMDYDKTYQVLTSIGSYHATIRGFQPEYFRKAEVPVLEAIKEVLGDRCTPQLEGIYKTALKFIIDTLVHGCEIGREQNMGITSTTNSLAPPT